MRRLAVVAAVALAGGLAYSASGGGTPGRVLSALARELVRMAT